jgi:Flp pilus assembly protein TadG
MARIRNTSVRKRCGALALELAVLLPFLGLFFVGTVDFCRIFHDTQVLNECAQTAATFASGTARPPASKAGDDMAREAAVAMGSSLRPPLQADDVEIVHDRDVVTVTVSYSFSTISNFAVLPGTIVLRRSATAPEAARGPGGY